MSVTIGVGGPVGSGKTALLDNLCKQLRDKYSLAVVTNDIYTHEDADGHIIHTWFQDMQFHRFPPFLFSHIQYGFFGDRSADSVAFFRAVSVSMASAR